MRRLARWLFLFFAVSGFCSLVYQVVWLRLTMAAFGVTTPMVSIVLSVFMGGLALGSWAAGTLARRPAHRLLGPLRLYAMAELLIAASGAVVPGALTLGRSLLGTILGAAWNSPLYYVAAGAWVAVCLLSFTFAMGATIPLAMWAIRAEQPHESPRFFSYLYVANVIGATTGTLTSAFVLIELLGFRGTLSLAAGLNALLAAGALALTLSRATARPAPERPEPSPPVPHPAPGMARRIASALFVTGLASLAMEVVWVRQFTPYLGTVVYAFAMILAVYLLATATGSTIYRRWGRTGPGMGVANRPWTWLAVAAAGLLPAVVADPRLPLAGAGLLSGSLRVVLGVSPFCALLGFVTPSLVDRWSQGDPDIAGRAYAINVVGGILGPLIAGFGLLPFASEPWALFVLAAPLLGLSLVFPALGAAAARPRWLAPATAAVACVALTAGVRTYETIYPGAVVRRDHTATVTAAGEGMQRRLLVNGTSMTYLTPITKMMAHLPLAFYDGSPRDGLVLCFGMGTSFRSVRSWGIPATAVELIPSVPELFGYFHADGPQLLGSSGSLVVIDDARRFLEWSPERFDVIVIDPPPPVQAAGSSLLYSMEFYQAARSRLRPGGILQQWVPAGDSATVASFVMALSQSFPHVRFMRSIEGWGLHMLASDRPIPDRHAPALAARLPEAAARDLVEWSPLAGPEAMFQTVLANEIPAEQAIPGHDVAPLRDDRPINEYFLLRYLSGSR